MFLQLILKFDEISNNDNNKLKFVAEHLTKENAELFKSLNTYKGSRILLLGE